MHYKRQSSAAKAGTYTPSRVGCQQRLATTIILFSAIRAWFAGAVELHLFDTFAGLPKPTEKDGRRSFYEGQFPATLDEVKDYLKGIDNVQFYKGLFPQSAEPIREKRIAFVHLDLDIYQSTYDALQFFYHRMNKGGIILSHDYHYEGVHRAFDEVFCDKPETVLSISARQALVVKL